MMDTMSISVAAPKRLYRRGGVLHEFYVRQELIVGRLVKIKKTLKENAGFLIFAEIHTKNRELEVLIPINSPLYSQSKLWKGKVIQAHIETIKINGEERMRLLDIDSYSPHTLPLFSTYHAI